MIRVDLNLRDYIYQKIALINTDAEFRDKLRKGLQQINLNLSEEIIPDDFKSVRVSQLVGCPRKEFFRLSGILPYIEPETFITLQIGSDVHYLIQLILQDDLIDYEGSVELKFNDKFRIVGHYDGLLKYRGGLYILEFKSLSPYALDKVLKEVATVEQDYNSLTSDMALYRYLQQGNTYIKLLNNPDVTGGYLILINKAVTKNAGALLPVKFDYDKELAEKAIRNGENIIKSLQENTIPAPSNSEWECRYCGYYNCDMNKNPNKKGVKNGSKN